MRFSELLDNDAFKDTKMRLSDMGAINFGPSTTNKNTIVTPHVEMAKGIEMFERNAIVNSGLLQLLNFVIPNKELKVSSEDEWTVNFLNDWHKQRKGILNEIKNIWLTSQMTGNGYEEKFYAKTTDGKPVLDNVFSINDATRIYINPDSKDGSDKYIFELPVGTKQFMYRGELVTPTYYKVTYIKNYQFTMKLVYGFPIPDWKISHYSIGWSRDNIYGRSPIVAAMDAHNIMQEIMSSWDTISKTRQIDQTIISVADTESGLQVPQERLDELAETLEDADKSYTLFNVPLKILSQEINTSGRYDLMEGVFDILRRMLITSLLPNHLTPWSDSATTQGAEAAMPPLLGRIKAAQNDFINFLNDTIIAELRKTYPEIAEDATYVFDEPKIIDDRYYIDKMVSLIDAGIISVEVAKQTLLKLGIIPDDIVEDAEEQEEPDSNEPEQQNKEQPQTQEAFHEDDETIEESFTEALKGLNAEMSFPQFRRRLVKKNPKLKTDGWKQLRHSNVGGHDIRTVQVDEETIILFDGLNTVSTMNVTEKTDKKLINKFFDDYVQNVKDSFEDFKNDENETDRVIDQLETEVKDLMKQQLEKVEKLIDKSAVKKESFNEAFLSMNIFPKLDDLFKGFNKQINSSVNRAINRLGLHVVDDTEDNVKPDDKVKQLLDRKKKLMIDSIKRSVKTTKDKMLTDIKTQLSNGIAAGQDIKDIKSNIRKNFNYDKKVDSGFNRIVRTSVGNASKIMKLKKYQAMGFETAIWITRDDSKVRDAHAKMNNKEFKIDYLLKAISDNTLPGTIFNCRCTVLPGN